MEKYKVLILDKDDNEILYDRIAAQSGCTIEDYLGDEDTRESMRDDIANYWVLGRVDGDYDELLAMGRIKLIREVER